MSMFFCEGCQANVDSDFVDFVIWNDNWICGNCWGPEQTAQFDFQGGGSLEDCPYDYDPDPLSDCQRYRWHMHCLQAQDFGEALNKMRFGKCL